MRLTGKPKSPEQFAQLIKTPENIHAYYQETLGPKLTKDGEVGSLLAERVLYHLHRHVPKRLADARRKYFVPGMPANVALLCTVMEILQHRYVKMDIMELCEDVPHAITLNRVTAMVLSFNLCLDSNEDFQLRGSYPVETIGLMDTIRRNMALARATGMTIMPASDVDEAIAHQVFEMITSD